MYTNKLYTGVRVFLMMTDGVLSVIQDEMHFILE